MQKDTLIQRHKDISDALMSEAQRLDDMIDAGASDSRLEHVRVEIARLEEERSEISALVRCMGIREEAVRLADRLDEEAGKLLGDRRNPVAARAARRHMRELSARLLRLVEDDSKDDLEAAVRHARFILDGQV